MRLALAIPTVISLLRLLLTPFIAIDILGGRTHRALALFVVAGFTDWLDGWVARRFQLSTRFGAWMDPVGDKLLLTTIYVCLGVAGVFPVWLVAIVVGRDVFILLMAGIAIAFTRVRDFPPSRWGKLSTFVQLTAAVVALSLPHTVAAAVAAWAAALGTTGSGLHYAWSGWRIARKISGAPGDGTGLR